MEKLEHPDINTSGLTAEVRKAIARHLLKSQARSANSAAMEDPGKPTDRATEEDNSTAESSLSTELNFAALNLKMESLPKSPRLERQTAFEPNSEDHYHINDLLKFHDADFVSAAYRAILKRELDSFGFNRYLDLLRQGHIDKIDLLSILRYSSEGKLKNVTIDGLVLPSFARRLGRLPVVGYPFRLVVDFLRLPVLIRRTSQQQAQSIAQTQRVAEHVRNVIAHTDTIDEALASNLSNLSAALSDVLKSAEFQTLRHEDLKQQLEALTEYQQKFMVDLQEQLRKQIVRERSNLQEQTEILIQHQQSLLESSTSETRSRIAKLDSSTKERIDRLGSSANARIDQLKSSTTGRINRLDSAANARIDQLDSSTTGRINKLESAANARIDQLDSSTATRINELDSAANARIDQLDSSTTARLNNFDSSANARIDHLDSSARARISDLETSIRAKMENIESATNDIRSALTESETTISDLGARVRNLESSADDLRTTTDTREASTQAEFERLYQKLQHARSELALQGTRMALILEEAQRRLPAPFDRQQLQVIASEEQHRFDALYAELEDNFRGSYEEIKGRFRTYLPHIKSLGIEVDKPIIDLGCGRGEWLELLKEEGYVARGVDTNQVMLERCRARGLDVIESDALHYLRGLPDNSLPAVTGFHIIEHLQFEVLMNLLDETIRVLHPGGIVIFETPNPENVLVGSNFFYFDPTHRNPVPSLLMEFLFESRGLSRIEVMNLHSWDHARLGGKNKLTARFNELFYGPMDYAIAGWKVSE